MGPLAVVALEPGVGEIPDLADRFKGIRIEYFGAVAPIEAFDVRILIGLTRLNVVHCHTVGFAPVHDRLCGEFGSVVPSE